MADDQALIDIWRSRMADTRCLCGRNKARRDCFCAKCLAGLPKMLKGGLGGVNGAQSGAETYQLCVEWLEENMYLGQGATNKVFGGKRV